MKKTKQADNRRNREKLSFRINFVEDKKLISYIDKSSNGSAFIKEAINFYIRAIEKGLVKSYYLETDEDRWNDVIESMANIKIDTPVEEYPTFGINDFDTDENDYIFDDIADIYKG